MFPRNWFLNFITYVEILRKSANIDNICTKNYSNMNHDIPREDYLKSNIRQMIETI